MSNLNELKPIGTLRPFTRFCCTIGNLPSSYMSSLTYEEQLMWFCDYLKNTVIPAVNQNAEAVLELQNLYIQLKNYVDNYFENLDVQEEINNKLDEMVENGTFERIINQEIFGNINNSITNIENNFDNYLKFQNNRLNFMLNNNQIPKLLFTGDSLTYGQGASTSYPTLIKNFIDENFNIDLPIFNFGVSGAKSINANNNFNTYLENNPDIIFWEYGINDANNNENPNYTIKNLVDFYNLCRENNIELIVILPTPTYKTGSLIKTNYLMEQLYKTIKNTCEKLGIIYINMYKFISQLFHSNGEIIPVLIPDGTHFSDYSIYSNKILSELLSNIYTLDDELNTNIFSTAENGLFQKTNGTNTGYNDNYATGNMLYFNYNDYNYEFTFFNSYPIYLDIMGFEKNTASNLQFLIDNTSFSFDEYNEFNESSNTPYFNAYYRYPNIIKPGIHKIKLNLITPSVGGNSAYLQGFIFTKSSNLNMPSYLNHTLWSGSLQNGNITLKDGFTFKKTNRIILCFNRLGYYQNIPIQILRKPNETTYTQIFLIRDSSNNISAGNISININSNTCSIVNNSDFNLIRIINDVGSINNPFNY